MIEPLLRREWEEDGWGYAPGLTAAVQPWLDLLHDRWFRVKSEGVGNVPTAGRALLVANHAGLLPPWEALVLGTVLRKQGRRDDPRFLLAPGAFDVPWGSVAVRRFGGVPASPYNAVRLLEDDKLVVAFPEGADAARKERPYRLARFGRGGFVEVALRTQAPIVPVAIVGSEELRPRLPFLPPLPGPLKDLPLPLPSRWRVAFLSAVRLDLPPEAAEDRALVLQVADEVRDRVQQAVHEQLVARENAFR